MKISNEASITCVLTSDPKAVAQLKKRYIFPFTKIRTSSAALLFNNVIGIQSLISSKCQIKSSNGVKDRLIQLNLSPNSII